ncbi:hypothetical protein [Leptolyngbya sp. FACHB-1624]|nr:hypothetical protein [Leptolyngbya sp. FACHB-1624]
MLTAHEELGGGVALVNEVLLWQEILVLQCLIVSRQLHWHI